MVTDNKKYNLYWIVGRPRTEFFRIVDTCEVQCIATLCNVATNEIVKDVPFADIENANVING